MAGMIAIRTWHNEIRVARDHPTPERLRDPIEALTGEVAHALGEGLDAWLARKDDAVILVRELVFDCDIDVRADPQRAARAVAARCARVLVRSIEERSADVIRYPTRAAFLARFVADLAGGSAGGRWWYTQFDGVRALPTAAAIRTVLVADPACGRAALAAMEPAAWPAVTRALSNDEAARVLEGLVDAAAGAPQGALDVATWRAAIEAADLGALAAPPLVVAVRLLAEALRLGVGGERIDSIAARMLGAIVVRMRVGDLAAVEALLDGDVAALARTQPALAASLAAAWVGSEGPALHALARALVRAVAPCPAPAAREDEPLAIPAPFTGLGLLLEEIDTLLHPALVATLPGLDDAPARALAALTALALGGGDGRAGLAWHDTAWRAFLGLPAALRWDSYVAALEARGDAGAAAAQASLAHAARRHQRGAAAVTAFRGSEQRRVCHVDAGGLWLELRRRPASGPARPGDPRAAAGAARRDDLSRAADAAGSDPSPAPVPGASDPPPDGVATPFATRLAAARRARADWRDLADEPLAAALPAAWRDVFVACAQIAWRRVAQRVPGMEGAPIAYLRRNLVGSGGTATRLGPAHWRWSVDRAPLHVLLALTGIARSRPSWSGPPPATFEWEFRT